MSFEYGMSHRAMIRSVYGGGEVPVSIHLFNTDQDRNVDLWKIQTNRER